MAWFKYRQRYAGNYSDWSYVEFLLRIDTAYQKWYGAKKSKIKGKSKKPK